MEVDVDERAGLVAVQRHLGPELPVAQRRLVERELGGLERARVEHVEVGGQVGVGGGGGSEDRGGGRAVDRVGEAAEQVTLGQVELLVLRAVPLLLEPPVTQ